MAAIHPTDTVYLAVGAVSAQYAGTLLADCRYVIVSSTAAWVAIGTAPTAAKQTTGSHYVPANTPFEFVASDGVTHAAIIEDSAGGSSTLSRARD